MISGNFDDKLSFMKRKINKQQSVETTVKNNRLYQNTIELQRLRDIILNVEC